MELLFMYASYLMALTTVINGFAIDNEIIGVPNLQCGEDAIAISFPTRNAFVGNVYIKGKFHDPSCHAEFYQNVAPSGSLAIKIPQCGMKRIRQLQPQGMNYILVFVVTFHPQFVTKVDRAFNVRCFYGQVEKTITSQLEVSMLTTQSLEVGVVIMPNCAYSVRSNTLNGPQVRYIRVGDRLVHRWECDNPRFGMLVKNCFVNDGYGSSVRVVDAHGCPVLTPVVQGVLQYDPSLTLAYVEVWAYKFPDRNDLFFQCQIQVCNKRENECTGLTPPQCGQPRNQIQHPPPARIVQTVPALVVPGPPVVVPGPPVVVPGPPVEVPGPPVVVPGPPVVVPGPPVVVPAPLYPVHPVILPRPPVDLIFPHVGVENPAAALEYSTNAPHNPFTINYPSGPSGESLSEVTNGRVPPNEYQFFTQVHLPAFVDSNNLEHQQGNIENYEPSVESSPPRPAGFPAKVIYVGTMSMATTESSYPNRQFGTTKDPLEFVTPAPFHPKSSEGSFNRKRKDVHVDEPQNEKYDPRTMDVATGLVHVEEIQPIGSNDGESGAHGYSKDEYSRTCFTPTYTTSLICIFIVLSFFVIGLSIFSYFLTKRSLKRWPSVSSLLS